MRLLCLVLLTFICARGLKAEFGDPGIAQGGAECFALPMACVALVPRAEQDIRAALGVLAFNSDLKDKVVEELLKVGVRNLGFQFCSRTRPRWAPLLARLTARLRRAWTASRVYFSQVELGRSKVALAHLDA